MGESGLGVDGEGTGVAMDRDVFSNERSEALPLGRKGATLTCTDWRLLFSVTTLGTPDIVGYVRKEA